MESLPINEVALKILSHSNRYIVSWDNLSQAVITFCPQRVGFTPLPTNIFCNNLASNVPNNILRNLSFYYFTSFSVVSFTPFTIKTKSSRALTIFIIFSTSIFKIVNAVISELWIFFWKQHQLLTQLLLILMIWLKF